VAPTNSSPTDVSPEQPIDDLTHNQHRLDHATLPLGVADYRPEICHHLSKTLAIRPTHVPGRPKIKRERDRDAQRIRQLRDEGQSYREIADELGRSTMDVYRVAMTLGCAEAGT